MTRTDLLDELAARLKAELSGVSLANKNGSLQQINIFTQWLPQPAGITFDTRNNNGLANYQAEDYEANFPCVIVRIEDMTDAEENKLAASTVNVTIQTAIYDASPECQGYRDILNVQERIRQSLLEHRIIGGQFILRMPMKSKLLNPDTWPVWWGEQEMTYTLGRPVQDWEYVNGGKRPPLMR